MVTYKEINKTVEAVKLTDDNIEEVLLWINESTNPFTNDAYYLIGCRPSTMYFMIRHCKDYIGEYIVLESDDSFTAHSEIEFNKNYTL